MNPSLFRLEALFEDFEHLEGMLVLGSSDARNLSLGDLNVVLPDSMSLGYTPPAGTPELIAVLCTIYGVSAKRVLVTNGANEGVFLAIASSVERGDRVLVPFPHYQSLSEPARLAGGDIVTYSYDTDADALLAAIADGVRLVVLNSPHNPTGHVLSESLLRAVLSSGATVIVDEVMHGIVHVGVERVPSAATLSDDAIVVGSTSKVFGLGGLRIGWIIAPEPVIVRCKRWRYYTTICPPAVSQVIAAAALRNASAILARNERLVRANLRIAAEWAAGENGRFELIRPAGGTTAILRLHGAGIDTETFARRLAIEERVFIVPCDLAFEMPAGYLRLGLGGDSDVLREGLRRLGGFAARWERR